jgi:hypothetical protein
MESFDLGYLMGLIAGEGCFTGPLGRPTLTVKLRADDPEPLRQFFRAPRLGPLEDRSQMAEVPSRPGRATRRHRATNRRIMSSCDPFRLPSLPIQALGKYNEPW